MSVKWQMIHFNQCLNVSIKYEQTALQFEFKDLLLLLPDSYVVFSNMNIFSELKTFLYSYYTNTEKDFAN